MDQKNCQLYLDGVDESIDDMKPEAKIVVYRIEHYDKQVLYGSTVIKLDGFSKNDVRSFL